MAESIVSFAVERIGGLLVDEAKFLLNVSDQVEDLQKNLTELQCLLKDADSRQEEGDIVRNWVSEIRDLAYDAEDVIESYILKVTSQKDKNFVKTCANYLKRCVCVDVHRAGSQIERINSRLPDLKRNMLDHGIRGSGTPPAPRRPSRRRKEYGHVIEEDYVGMKDYIDDVVTELVSQGKQHRVVSLWGMGGLGKTSLARKVYMDDRVRDHFQSFAWVCISQEYQVESILVEILKSLMPEKAASGMTIEDLVRCLYEVQMEKRCLVVLDDIWTDDAWDSLKAAFPIRNSRSRILITTRNREIAHNMDPHSFISNLRCLSEEEGWELLKRRAFLNSHERNISTEMEDLGSKIIKQCGYLPLAIIVIGGVLANKMGVDEWELVHRSIDLHLRKSNGEVSNVLDLSYNELPYYLKPCFLYMANFAEDSRVPARNLLRMWIAEGFVSYPNKGDESVVDVAESYLNELVDRGIIQAQLKKRSGRVGQCYLHDLIRDLCIRKAKEENFSHVIKLVNNVNEPTTNGSSSASHTCKIRRLSMNLERYPQPREPVLESIPHLRALIFYVYCGDIENMQPFQALMDCRLLRVLDMVAGRTLRIILPESVGDLVHLRYLRMWNFRLEALPSSIGNLEFLETLDLGSSPIQGKASAYIPNVLWKLKRLRELCLPASWIERVRSAEKLQLDSLENLEYFGNFPLRACRVKDLENFVNLRKFTCFYEDDGDGEGFDIFPILSEINFKYLEYSGFEFYAMNGITFPESKLRQISIYNRSCKLLLYGRIQKLPKFPPLLKKLVLTESALEEDPMPVLEKLPNLISLELTNNCFIGKKMVCSTGGFPQLKSLKLWWLLNLEELQVSEGSMPCLSKLEITGCAEMVPECLSFTASRQKLDFKFILKNYGDRNYFRVVKEEQRWVYRKV